MTNRRKALDHGYNFALDFISIGGLCAKLWAPKVAGVLVVGILRLSKQNAIWMWVSWKSTEYIIKGKVMASPSPGHGESCESELPVVRPSTKSVPTMH